MVVRLDLHLRSPAQIEDRHVGAAIDGFDARTFRFAERAYDLRGLAYRFRHELANHRLRIASRDSGAAIFDEALFVEHGQPPGDERRAV
jgi:hypothetical protein